MRVRLTAAAIAAKVAAAAKASCAPATPRCARNNATKAAPIHCPVKRAVLCNPLAAPLRALGAEPISVRLLGA